MGRRTPWSTTAAAVFGTDPSREAAAMNPSAGRRLPARPRVGGVESIRRLLSCRDRRRGQPRRWCRVPPVHPARRSSCGGSRGMPPQHAVSGHRGEAAAAPCLRALHSDHNRAPVLPDGLSSACDRCSRLTGGLKSIEKRKQEVQSGALAAARENGWPRLLAHRIDALFPSSSLL